MDTENLLKRPCPACGRETFGPRGSCLYCGAPFEEVSAETAVDTGTLPPPPRSEHTGQTFRCPGCKEVTMEEQEVMGVTAHQCPACQGMFLDGATLHWMVKRQLTMAHQGEHRPGQTQRGEAEAIVKYVHCPVCGLQMARKNYLNCSGVILDVCPPHGIWLDDTELQQLLIFIATGGHRLAEHLNKLDEEQVRLTGFRKQLDYLGPESRHDGYGFPPLVY